MFTAAALMTLALTTATPPACTPPPPAFLVGSTIDPNEGTAGCSMDPNGCQAQPDNLIGACCPENDAMQCPPAAGYAKVACGFPMCANGLLSCIYYN